ncbi:MAG: hypothetical protein BGO51_00160 [Rhodospirillales bacterium 69-11]|nr:MAG: hypothetical protein BGO51_00160 [Rhodospirillales bacterium 69-11]
MTHITGHDRSQMLLLPEAVDDYVGAENPVRFIDAFVDGMDLAAAGFARTAPSATGRPGYAPADLLKLYIYGYLNRVRSSRRLEVETHRNVEVIWLLRHLKPDFKTIADFRSATRVAVGYNAQIAVDARYKLIVDQQVTNQVLDMGLLAPSAVAAKEVLGVETIAVVGYLDDLVIVPLGIMLAVKLVPTPLMAEFRAAVAERESRPVSRAGLAVIVAVSWLTIAGLLWFFRQRLFGV